VEGSSFLAVATYIQRRGEKGKMDLALIFELHPSLKENLSCPDLHSPTHHICNTN